MSDQKTATPATDSRRSSNTDEAPAYEKKGQGELAVQDAALEESSESRAIDRALLWKMDRNLIPFLT